MLQIQISTSHHTAVYCYSFFCKWMTNIVVRKLFGDLQIYFIFTFLNDVLRNINGMLENDNKNSIKNTWMELFDIDGELGGILIFDESWFAAFRELLWSEF